MESLQKKVIESIEKYNMINYGDNILIALSGGADSVCLLLVLMDLQEKYNLSISAIHINHMLRAEESDSDEEFCVNLCKSLGVKLIVERHDVALYSKLNKLSIELAARNIRYEAFKKHSEGMKLATAHTSSDNAETVILNLTRGAGLKGLLGIPPTRDNIIRPLIFISRKEIEEYLNKKNQDFVTDSTNLSHDYTRNKIRHKIIPTLKEINPSLENTVSNNSSALELENNFINEQADIAYRECFSPPLSLCGLQKYHKAIRHRCIVRLINSAGLSYDLNRIFAIDDIIMSEGKINIANNVYIVSKKGTISIEKSYKKETVNIEFTLKFGVNKFSETKICHAEIINNFNLDISCSNFVNKKLNIYYLDYDKIIGEIILRNRRNGDKIKLANNNFTSSVKKLFNRHIPLNIRDEICFLADDKGVIFIENFGIDDRVKPTSDSKNILKICIQNILDRGE
ncbi:MAG: tRNA lysidine(34) synthetase TilS [Clostridiales bacterium]|nr:tRNA lysidine(34) synthetase TilS [Clostridiales bacterium]